MVVKEAGNACHTMVDCRKDRQKHREQSEATLYIDINSLTFGHASDIIFY